MFGFVRTMMGNIQSFPSPRFLCIYVGFGSLGLATSVLVYVFCKDSLWLCINIQNSCMPKPVQQIAMLQSLLGQKGLHKDRSWMTMLGMMTKYLALLVNVSKVTRNLNLNTEKFIDPMAEELRGRLSGK